MKNKFKLFFLLTALVCLMAAFTVTANADAVIDADVLPVSYDSIAVELTGGASFLTSTQFYVTYDADVVEYNSYSVISERTGDFASVKKIENGKLLVNFFASTHAYKNKMLKLDFSVLNTSASSYGFGSEVKNIYVSRDNSGADSSVLENGLIDWNIPTLTEILVKSDASEIFYETNGAYSEPQTETLEVTAVWSDGTRISIPAEYCQVSCPGFNTDSLGFHTVSVKFNGKETTYMVAVGFPTPEYIQVITPPAKTTYLQDSVEAFSFDGLVVHAFYSDGVVETADLDSMTVLEFNTKVAGEQTVILDYFGQTAELEITITPDIPDRIEIKKQPDLLKYKQDSVDEVLLNGIEVDAVFDGGSRVKTVDADDLTVSGFNPSKIGKQTITVTYRSKSATFTVEVEPLVVYPSRIEIIALPVKLDYFLNTQENLVTTGLKVKGIYDDGKEESIRLNDLEITGFDPTIEGPQTITIRYFETTTTFEINIVKEPDPTEPVNISITEQPAKQQYTRFSDEKLDLTGIVIKATLGNGEVVDVPVEEVSVSGFDLTVDDDMQLLTLTYKGCSTALIIAIVENTNIIYGDVDNSGSLSAADARLALRFSAGLETGWTADMETRADYNRDGSVTAYDARAILRASVGLTTD